MADRSKIEWTDASWNPIRARNTATGKIGWHCERATTGCAGCYAEAFNRRLGTGLPFKPGHLDRGEVKLFLDERMLLQPLRWTRPRTIFVGSMTDLFGRFVPDLWLDRIFAVMALTPQHDYQIVTKRSDRMRRYVDDAVGRVCATAHAMAVSDWPGWPLPNVWLGVSAERQEEADVRIPDLLQTPAAVRFVSAEPLLGPIDLTSIRVQLAAESWMTRSALYARDALDRGQLEHRLDWVIAGGESGRNARPMHPDWARSLRDQCQAAGVAFFHKQNGEWLPWSAFNAAEIEDDPEQTRFATMEWEGDRWVDAGRPIWCDVTDGHIDDEQCVGRVGKSAAGRLLDGIEHNAMPERDR
ncbi:MULTISPECIES: phage Gp37/Gp68 family protein [unclassified Bradyrhizobium]|uniref:DUF5131 family protein n=1 Tax=unclassified Bradyrhizobium TaxID=2631580 RepID=UPI002915CA6F|nr:MULTISPECIES: phage Gp37/Gp68 family protein [unclassified Bradyrhizobium]